ncbi:hypothetical protein Cgig2_023129 [Carnegiea gigantea]|uniref:Uncharacterized protein n=1 Tax=Carnegiea gigantea TaxID=171969 RepID=A0A9Q1JRK1_9CARY|nr:hypothetical protein Cgig2_023129 [Carnegiea gigantea]
MSITYGSIRSSSSPDIQIKNEYIKLLEQWRTRWNLGETRTSKVGKMIEHINKDENEFPEEYGRHKTIDKIDYQSIFMKVKLTCRGISKHDTRNLRAHRTFGISPWPSTSPLATMFRIGSCGFKALPTLNSNEVHFINFRSWHPTFTYAENSYYNQLPYKRKSYNKQLTYIQ